MKIFIYKICFIILLAGSLLQSCVKDINTDVVNETPILSNKIQEVTAYGTVTDKNNTPIQGAEVIVVNSIGTYQKTITNLDGYYEFFDTKVKGETLIVSVLAEEMFYEEFHLSTIDKSVIKRDIILTQKTLLGDFNSEEGGILLNENLTLDFPKESIVNVQGQPYQGIVKVYAGINDPLKDIFRSINNGAAITLDETNKLVSKISYQNLYVDLKSPNGEKLEVKEGKTILTKVALQANAPQDILNKSLSLMHYDESNHYWTEETSGKIEDGYYVAELPHFSTWSWCDIFSNPVHISGEVNLLENGIPYNASTYVLFDFEFVKFMVSPSFDGKFTLKYGPSNVPFDLKILNECEEIIYSQSYSGDIDSLGLGRFDIETPSIDYHTLNVNVYNCDSTAVSKGYSRFCIDDLNYTRCQIVPIENGVAQYSFLGCNSNLNGELFLLNEENLLTTEPIFFNLADQDIVLPYVTLCDTFTNNITLYVEGNLFYSHYDVDFASTSAPSNFFLSGDGNGNGISIGVNGRVDHVGQYELGFASFANADSSIYVKDWNPNGLAEIQSIINDPDNPGWKYPKHLEGTFSGEVEQIDPISGSVIGTLFIEGTVYID